MAFFGKKKSPFPLKNTAFINMTDALTFKALDMVVRDSDAGIGGLCVVMQGMDKKLKLVHLDTLLTSQTGKPYSTAQCSADILNSIRHIRHATENPALYDLKSKRKDLAGKLVLAAIVTPVDVTGVITKDADAYGWQISAITGKNINLDVFVQDGTPVSGSIEFYCDLHKPESIISGGRTAKVYYDSLAVGRSVRHDMMPLVQELLGHNVAERTIKRLENAS